MDFAKFLIPVIQYSLAGIIVFFVAWYYFLANKESGNSEKVLELRKAVLSQTLPLKLQAYERVILFIDRINPANMMLRLTAPGMNVASLQQQILNEVRSEYQHNVAQQLYINPKTWLIVHKVKEDTISLINNVSKTIPGDAPASELSKGVLMQLVSLDIENPYQSAASIIKSDIQDLF